jgi:hypothetical protein
VICANCGLGFPDEQTGTPLEHKVERCRELGEPFAAYVHGHIRGVVFKSFEALYDQGLMAGRTSGRFNA